MYIQCLLKSMEYHSQPRNSFCKMATDSHECLPAIDKQTNRFMVPVKHQSCGSVKLVKGQQIACHRIIVEQTLFLQICWYYFPSPHYTYQVVQVSLHTILLPLFIVNSTNSCKTTFDNDCTGCEITRDSMAVILMHCPFKQTITKCMVTMEFLSGYIQSS